VDADLGSGADATVTKRVVEPHHMVLETVPPGPEQPVWRQVLGEVRWSFTRPWTWLTGVAVNLVLSLAWLVAVPLTGRPHSDWAIIVGSYFAVFILADVTTTNVLGADALRVRLSLLRAIPLRRILWVKNLTLLLIVGLPTLIATAVITVRSENDYRLILTLPGVAFPILTWLGVGNIVSIALPVAVAPLRERWQERHRRGRTARWLVHLVLPYAMLYAVNPIAKLPRLAARHLTFLPQTTASHGALLCLLGLSLWAIGTAVALLVARLHPIRIR
jgi:hypothetical protein